MTTRKLKIDPEVSEMEKTLKIRERPIPQKIAMIASPIAFMSVLMGTIIAFVSSLQNSPTPSFGAVFGIVALVCVGGLGVLVVWGTGTHGSAKTNQNRKKTRRSLQQSVNAARQVSDSVPVLTKEHIEAGYRFDSIILSREPEISMADERAIRALHLSDLSREPAIFSLIADRGVTTIEGVRAALTDMESHGKPLQNGWL